MGSRIPVKLHTEPPEPLNLKAPCLRHALDDGVRQSYRVRCLASLLAQIVLESVPQERIRSGFPCSNQGISKLVYGLM